MPNVGTQVDSHPMEGGLNVRGEIRPRDELARLEERLLAAIQPRRAWKENRGWLHKVHSGSFSCT